MILYALLSYGSSGLLWFFQIVGGPFLIFWIFYFFLVLQIVRSDRLVKFWSPVFRVQKVGQSLISAAAEQKYQILRQWIVIEARPHTGLPEWFLKDSKNLRKELAQSGHSDFWPKIQQDIENSLLAKGCYDKCSDFSKAFLKN